MRHRFAGAQVALLFLSVFVQVEAQNFEGAVISGKVPDGDIDRVTVSSYPPPIDDGWSVASHPDDLSASVTAARTFEAAIPVAKSGFHRLSVGNDIYDVYLSPGSQVDWEHGGENRPVTFSGDHAASNQQLLELGLALDGVHSKLLAEVREVYALGLDGFMQDIDQREQNVLAAHHDWLKQHPETPAAIAHRAQVDIRAHFDRYRLIYPSLFRNITGNRAEVSQDYFRTILARQTLQPQDLFSRKTVAMLDSFVDLESAGRLKFEDENAPREKLVSRYQTIKKMDVDASVKDYLLEQMFRTFETNYGPADWGPVKAAFAADFPGHALLPAVTATYQKAMAIRTQADEIRVFRRVDGVDLEAHVFYPSSHKPDDRRAAFVTLHGGGWASGTPEWSYPGAQRMAEQGMVAISFEYRLADVHGSDMSACVDDTRQAISWVRENARDLGVDPNKVVAHGFSAGAHLVGINAILTPADALDVSARPNALILHSSTYNTLKSGFFTAMTQGNPKTVSLTHQVKPGLVPTLLIHGKYDHLAPEDEFMEFVGKMQAHKNDFEYHLFETGHFFRNTQARSEVHRLTDQFLNSRGFLASDISQSPGKH